MTNLNVILLLIPRRLAQPLIIYLKQELRLPASLTLPSGNFCLPGHDSCIHDLVVKSLEYSGPWFAI
jgi:hypothetical protein